MKHRRIHNRRRGVLFASTPTKTEGQPIFERRHRSTSREKSNSSITSSKNGCSIDVTAKYDIKWEKLGNRTIPTANSTLLNDVIASQPENSKPLDTHTHVPKPGRPYGSNLTKMTNEWSKFDFQIVFCDRCVTFETRMVESRDGFEPPYRGNRHFCHFARE